MRIAEIKNLDIANGPGGRVSVFVSGCNRHCPGCFNEIAWDFNYGVQFDDSVLDSIRSLLSNEKIAGISILGGEPFEIRNQPGVASIIDMTKIEFPEKNIWCFTGYTIDELLNSEVSTVFTQDVLSKVDVLVDGPFIQAQRNLMLQYRGSENQRLIDVPETLKSSKVVLWKDDYSR